jgi:hypothetical protein
MGNGFKFGGNFSPKFDSRWLGFFEKKKKKKKKKTRPGNCSPH